MYYTTNDVYQRLNLVPSPRLIWVSGSAWILVYADRHAIPKVLVSVEGTSMGTAGKDEVARFARAREVARELAAKAGLPFATIQFDDQAPEIDHVALNKQPTSLADLKDWFASVGLPVNAGTVQKAINSKGSSAYQVWQRQNLGAITVTDIDLLRLADDGMTVTEIIELKRSYYELERWQPFRQDYPNFDVVAEVAARVGARFVIAYNRRVTSPFCDDASRLRLFSYSTSHGSVPIGVMPFEQFVAGDY